MKKLLTVIIAFAVMFGSFTTVMATENQDIDKMVSSVNQQISTVTADTTENCTVTQTDSTDDISRATALLKQKYNNEDYSFNLLKLGNMQNNAELYVNIPTEDVLTVIVRRQIESYTFEGACPQSPYELGVYVIANDVAYTLEEAYSKNLLNMAEVYSLIKNSTQTQVRVTSDNLNTTPSSTYVPTTQVGSSTEVCTQPTDISTKYSVNIENRANAKFSNEARFVCEHSSYETDIDFAVEKPSTTYTMPTDVVLPEKTNSQVGGFNYIKIYCITSDGKIIEPQRISATKYHISVPDVTGNIYITTYLSPKRDETIVGSEGVGLVVYNMKNCTSTGQSEANDNGRYKVIGSGTYLFEETITPDKGYEITSIKVKIIYMHGTEKNMNFNVSDIPSDDNSSFEVIADNGDGTYNLTCIPIGSIYIEVTAERKGTSPEPDYKECVKELLKSKYNIHTDSEYFDYSVLGVLGDYNLIFIKPVYLTNLCYDVRLGNYRFNAFAQQEPYDLGLYVVNDKSVYTLDDAYDIGIADMDKVYQYIKDHSDIHYNFVMYNEPVSYPNRVVSTENAEQVLKVNLPQLDGIKLRALGSIGEYDLFFNQKHGSPSYKADETYDGYIFCGAAHYPEYNDIGLYLVNNDTAYTFDEAYKKNLINMDDVYTLINENRRLSDFYSFNLIKESEKPIPIPDNSKKYKVVVENHANATFTNKQTVIKENQSYGTCIIFDKPDDFNYLTLMAITSDGKIIRPQKITDEEYYLSVPQMTGNLYITTYLSHKKEPGWVGGEGYGLAVYNLNHCTVDQQNVEKYGTDYSVITNGTFIQSITVKPESGYKISSIKAKVVDMVGDENLGIKYNVEELKIGNNIDGILDNGDGTYTVQFLAVATSVYIEATAEKSAEPQPQPTKPVVKNPVISAKSLSLKSAQSKTLKVSNGKVKSWSTSDKTKVTVKNGKVTALNKGEATITATLTDGKKLTCRVNVTTAPKLSKAKVTVKKNRTVTVKITGKVSSVNNKYVNTKLAKIISKTNQSTVKIKGLKCGTTTLKIKVNGVKTLSLRVVVKK